jgi:hypothetical protein
LQTLAAQGVRASIHRLLPVASTPHVEKLTTATLQIHWTIIRHTFESFAALRLRNFIHMFVTFTSTPAVDKTGSFSLGHA